MITTTLAMSILAGFGFYVMTPEERGRLLDAVRGVVLRVIDALKDTPASQPFNDFLRARTQRTVVTPVLVALHSVVFVLMLFGSGAFSDPQTLVHWGANFAPRTTNGEWWRLLSAMVVHAGFLHLLVTIASLVSLGFVLERAVGPYPFAAVYLSAGILANVVNLWTAPALSASAGGAGPVFGMYGLLLASLTWTIVGRPDGSIPLQLVKRIGSAAAIFFLYNWLTNHLGTTSELAGLTAGVVGGLVVSRGVVREKPPVQRAIFVMAAGVVVAALCVVPVRGTVDVRSEIASVIAVEQRTAGAYDAAVAKFRKGSLSAAALATFINESIMPELKSARARLQTLRGVPREHRRVVGAAEEFLQLREQSWRSRGEALHDADMDLLREADRTEQAAMNAFHRIKPVG